MCDAIKPEPESDDLTRREFLAIPLTVGASALGAFSEQAAPVSIRIRDADTGRITPAMICITGEDGSVRLPPDGRVLEKPSSTRDYYAGIRYRPDPGWIGPVRKMQGRGDNDDRSFVYDLSPSIPYWREPVQHYSSGDFTIALPKGRWRVAVDRGMETIPAVREFDVGDGGAPDQTIELRRWIHLPREGWWSGDVHVHHPTKEPAHREFLLRSARASDLHVVNTLEMGHHLGTDFHQDGFGEKHRVRDGDFALVSGQEEPRSTFGHVIGLNLSSLVRDIEHYDFYDLAFRRMHEQEGAVVGYAHFAWNGCDLPRGFPWYVTTGEIDFIELLQFAQLNAPDYYDYLNLGFRLTAAAGSDIPWGSAMGEVRTFVHTGPRLDLDAWFEGMRAGRTFVSNGPALDFTVDGQLPGSVLERKAGDTVKVTARVRSHPAIGLPKTLTLVGNEGILREAGNPGKESELSLTLERRLDRGQWLAASAVCVNNAVAHATPIYLRVDGQSHRDPKRGPAIVEKQLAAIDAIAREFDPSKDDRERGIIERIEKARAFYTDLVKRMVSDERIG